MPEHTPLPWTASGDDLWHFGEDYESKTDPHRYTGISIEKSLRQSPIAKANLELIVTAVNSHSALRTACEAALKFIRLTPIRGGAANMVAEKILAQLQAALGGAK